MGNIALAPSVSEPAEEDQHNVLSGNVTVGSFAARLAAAGKASVTVVCGAGISVSAGIPDFRTPGSGLYDNLQKYGLPTPESIFTLDYFKENPLPFFQLAKEMYPGSFAPTPTHAFIRLLQDKGVLRRCFTQNIDTLERLAGINAKLLVEAHGSFSEAHCIECKAAHTSEWLKEEIFAERVPVRCPNCEGLVKPDIVFFGEGMPKRFSMMMKGDLPDTELLIVLGTSLSVQPFASTVNQVGPLVPRLLINKEIVGMRDRSGHGFRFDAYDNYRDVAILHSCDQAVNALASAAGWGADFDLAVATQRQSFTSTSVESLTGCPGVPAEALTRSWCRRLAGELPILEPVAASESPAVIKLLPRTQPIPAKVARDDDTALDGEEGADRGEHKGLEVLPSLGPSEVAGGETIQLVVRLPVDGNLAGDTWWVGLVPHGDKLPSRAVDRVDVKAESKDAATTLSLSVPPLKGRQLEPDAAGTIMYEVWLVRENDVKEDGPQGVVVSRTGPLTVAGFNADGVGVANRFAMMAVRSALGSAAAGGNTDGVGAAGDTP